MNFVLFFKQNLQTFVSSWRCRSEWDDVLEKQLLTGLLNKEMQSQGLCGGQSFSGCVCCWHHFAHFWNGSERTKVGTKWERHLHVWLSDFRCTRLCTAVIKGKNQRSRRPPGAECGFSACHYLSVKLHVSEKTQCLYIRSLHVQAVWFQNNQPKPLINGCLECCNCEASCGVPHLETAPSVVCVFPTHRAHICFWLQIQEQIKHGITL